MSKYLFYGITQELKCSQIRGAQDFDSLKKMQDINQYKYIICRTESRQSASGINTYYRTTVHNTIFQEVNLEYGDVKITDVSEEYWCNLGGFNKDEEVIYFPRFQPIYHDEDFSLTDSKWLWEILKEPSSGKLCFVKLQDKFGFVRFVSTSFFDEKHIESTLNHLKILNLIKSFAGFKFALLLMQFKKLEKYNLTASQNQNAQIFFNRYLRKAYNECKKYHPDFFHDSTGFEELYDTLKRQYESI